MDLLDYFECCTCNATWEMKHANPNQVIYHNQPSCPKCGSKYVKWVNYEELAKKKFRA